MVLGNVRVICNGNLSECVNILCGCVLIGVSNFGVGDCLQILCECVLIDAYFMCFVFDVSFVSFCLS